MRSIALDTNAYVAFKRGDQAVLEVVQNAGHLQLSFVVLGELLAGFSAANPGK